MGNFFNKVFGVIRVISSNPSDLKKFFKPSVSRGHTVWPKTSADLLRYGVRWDYDGVVTYEGKECHRFQLQPNAGKIPSTIKEWREKHGGTHAVICVMYIPAGTDPDPKILEEAAQEALKDV
ncbi:MAG: hypothetical protein M1817_002136 [Caeruleum heppii]|nr:MAG: hypothetical protein M1817_002136 [Caeruleum heppii]